MTWQPILISIVLISSSCAELPVFKSNAAEKVSWKFKDVPKVDVAKIILEWEPNSMLENNKPFTEAGVSIKSGDGDFVKVSDKPRMRGGKYIHNIEIIPCVDNQIQLFIENAEGPATFDDFENLIPASSAENISASSFILQAPTNSRVDSDDSTGSVAVYWDPSQCATSYAVNFIEYGTDKVISKEVTEAKVEVTELNPCSEYSIIVSAILGEEWSEELVIDSHKTLPSVEGADKIIPDVTPSMNGVDIKFKGYDTLACIDQYQVTLCEDEGTCQEAVNVKMDNSLPYVQFTSEDNLYACTEYSVHIKPLYPEMNMEQKSVKFSTLSPPIADLVSELGPVSAVSGDDQSVTVSWSPVTCGAEYHVSQQLVTPEGDGEWEVVTTSVESSIQIKGVPCTEYKYGVSVVVDGVTSEIVTADGTVTTPLDGDHYTAPNLVTNSSPNQLSFTWDHAQCIQSYRVNLCPETATQCSEEIVTPDTPLSPHITFSFSELTECSPYSLEISANTNGKELTGEPFSVRTSAPEVVTPGNFQYELNEKSNTISLSYDPVVCASSYKIYQILDNEQESVYQETNLNLVSIDSPEPCSDFRFAVAALVDGEEGPRSEFLGEKIPPRNGDSSKPTIKIIDKFNKTVVMTLTIPGFNQKCEVESYQIKYHNLADKVEKLETTIPSESLKDGKIVLDSFPQAVSKGVKIEGRIKYHGFESWSPWISSQSQKPEIMFDDGNGIIVPIVIGAMIAVVVLVVLIFFIVKRKKSQNKYNCDIKDKSENKKLNEEEA